MSDKVLLKRPISLSSFTNIKEVKEKFNEWFDKPRFNAKKIVLKHPPIADEPQLLGTAFDYLLRFKLKYLDSKAIAEHWVAEKGLLGLKIRLKTKNYRPRASKQLIESWLEEGEPLFALAKENYSKFLTDGKITNNLLRSCFHLAKIDSFYRVGYITGKIDNVSSNDTQDLQSLIGNIKIEQFKTKNVCLLSPTFSTATKISGIDGEADLVLDNILIDIKTYSNPKFKLEFFHQLMGYYLLSKIGGIDGAPEDHEIRKIAIYFSRNEYLHVIDVKDVFDQSKLTSILEWVIDKGKEITGLN